MYVIIVYDVDVSRVNKVKMTLRRYLYWVQNSVFEGEITETQLLILMSELENIIKDEDSVIIYKFSSKKIVKKEIMGREKGSTDDIL